MKLIYLLVQELPNRGGWPAGAVEAMSFNHNPGMIHFFDEEGEKVIDAIKFDGYKAPYIDTVTTEQYEAAIAASSPNSWNGEGLPPVGCECEREAPRGWSRCRINYVSNSLIVYQMLETGNEYASTLSAFRFRPIRTEADRKREDAIEALQLDESRTGVYITKDESTAIYNAIAAGEIPGVKLE